MPRRRSHGALSLERCVDGYVLVVSNGQQMFAASRFYMEKGSPIALGLAQIGQEEIGKSLLLLAAIALEPEEKAWAWFWKQWYDHADKMRAAGLYALISPQRVELRTPDGKVYDRKTHDGRDARPSASQEKEAAFYVDYDPIKQRFVAPPSAVTAGEAMSRIMHLSDLGLTASAVADTLLEGDSEFRFTRFASIALSLCKENGTRSTVSSVLANLQARSPRDAALVSSLTRKLEAADLYVTPTRVAVAGASPESHQDIGTIIPTQRPRTREES